MKIGLGMRNLTYPFSPTSIIGDLVLRVVGPKSPCELVGLPVFKLTRKLCPNGGKMGVSVSFYEELFPQIQ
jgi:hypothetical protein